MRLSLYCYCSNCVKNTAVCEAAETGSEEAADTPAGIETIQGRINFFGISKS